MTAIEAWSYTRINDAEKCKKFYQLKHILKVLPKPDFEAYHLKRGKLMHEAIEAALKLKQLGLINPELNPKLNMAGHGSVLKVPLDFLKPILLKMMESEGLIIEGQRAFDADLNLVSWFDGENTKKGLNPVWCRIIMDVFVKTSPTSMVVVDWKSGKPFTKVDQLRLSAGGAFAMYPEIERVFVAYIWLDRPDVPALTAEYTRQDDFEGIWQEFGDRAELIQMCIESGNWPASPSKFNCTWCDASPTQCPNKLQYPTPERN